MVEQNNNEVMIQLPWTVPQQPLVTTQISVDPKNPTIPLEIQHSTDTTAISSFALSVIIALILGCLATWLAYWYGRKSFQLTEMSFKTVVEEIKASQQSALDLNAKLFEQQSMLQLNKLQYAYKSAQVEKLRTIITEYLTCLIDFNTSITMKIKELEQEKLIQEIVKYNLKVANYHQIIELFLDYENHESHKNIKVKLKSLLDTLWNIRKEFEKDENHVNQKIIEFSIEFESVSIVLRQYLVQEIRRLRGE